MLRGKYDRKNTFLKDKDGYKTGAHFMKLLVLFVGGYHLLLMKIIELKINYFFTNDKDYINNYTAYSEVLKSGVITTVVTEYAKSKKRITTATTISSTTKDRCYISFC